MTLGRESKTPIARKLSTCIQCDECGRFYPPTVALKHGHED